MCIFFFKQKTAYERRISDWSSDVCSSDLYGNQRGIEAARSSRSSDGSIGCQCRNCSKWCGWILLDPGTPSGAIASSAQQCIPRNSIVKIGRASCRERVCQYV